MNTLEVNLKRLAEAKPEEWGFEAGQDRLVHYRQPQIAYENSWNLKRLSSDDCFEIACKLGAIIWAEPYYTVGWEDLVWNPCFEVSIGDPQETEHYDKTFLEAMRSALNAVIEE